MGSSVAGSDIIVAEPMSTIPYTTSETPPPTSTKGISSATAAPTSHASTPSPSLSTHAFPGPLSPCKSEALKPNPHPYPIRTTSTGVLSRSNSAASASTYQYQFYVPQSPGSPTKEFRPHNSTGGLGDKERKGGRHKYSKSLNVDGVPTPLPFPPTLRQRSRGDSASSLPSTGNASPTKMDEATGSDLDAPGEVSNPDIGREIKEEAMPPSAAAPFLSASVVDRPGNGDHNASKMRGRSLGTGEGGKVKGMVASLERSASLSGDDGDDDVAAETPYGRNKNGSSYVHHEHGRQRARYRRERVASDASASSAYLDSFDGVKHSAHDNKTENEGDSPSLPGDKDASQFDSTPFDSTRNREQPPDTAYPNERAIEDPTMEELLASTPWDPASFTNVSANGTIYDETLKIRHAGPTSSPTATITTTSIPNNLTVFSPSFPHSEGSAAQRFPNPNGEGTIEELFATLSSSSLSMSAGASAWERDIGSTVKYIKRGGDSVVSNQESTPETAPAAASQSDHPDVVQRPPSPTSSERELKIAQEMSETREMVRALSARVAGVEAKIGEMEVAAEDLQQRGRELAEDELAAIEKEKDELAAIEKEKEESPSAHASYDPAERTGVSQMFARRLVVSFSRSVVGVAQSFAEREGACAALVRMFLPSSSVPASSPAPSAPSSPSPKLRSREASQTREALSMWYKKSWACYLVFLGLGACAFVLREVVRRGLTLRGRRT